MSSKTQPKKTKAKKIKYSDVIAAEDVRLKERREKLGGKDFANALDENRFGIALSGGGIRSATINLGILKTLHKFGLLKQADYLSTVSGGGYTGAYIQATLKESGEPKPNKEKQAKGEAQTLNGHDHDQPTKLFDKSHIDYMRQHGEYLFPGKGLKKIWNQFTLVVAFLVSFIMSLVSPMILIFLVIGSYFFLESFGLLDTSKLSSEFIAHWRFVGPYILISGGSLFGLHYIFNASRVYKLDVSTWFNRMETTLSILLAITFIWPFIKIFRSVTLPDLEQVTFFLGIGLILLVLGFVTNPNATSFHRFYRKQLADAYLHFAVKNKNIEIHKLFDTSSEKESDYLAPYPLINTCLNLQSVKKSDAFVGVKANDYFLLSPLYCGSKLLGYVPTAESIGYKQMTLPAATTISAAAVNPGMGDYSNKILSILLTIFNLRLGFWTWNPEEMKTRWPIVWWPVYFFYELLGRIGTDKKMVNISDGGHIENLAAIELLRRKCKLTIAIDAGADPDFSFADLENLTVRARNELGLDIRFRSDQLPEDVMRVKPSHGYSKQRLAVADIYLLWETIIGENGKEKTVDYPGGKKSDRIFVYVKSAVKAPKIRKPSLSKKVEDYELKIASFFYKRFNPDFPHQSTADQFFDPVQWEAYFQLGQFIGSDIVSCDDLNKFEEEEALDIPLDELYKRFDENIQLFGTSTYEPPAARGIDEVVMDTTIGNDLEKPTGYEM